MKNFARIFIVFILFSAITKGICAGPSTDSAVFTFPSSSYITAITQWKTDSVNRFWPFQYQPEKKPSVEEKPVGIQRPAHNTSWLVLIVILSIVLVILCRAIDPEDIPGLFRLLGKSLSHPQKIREAGDELSLSSLLLSLNFILMFSAIFYYASEVFHFRVTFGITWYAIILGFSASAMLLRYLVLKFVGSLFSFRSQFDFFIFQELQYNRLLGIFLIPAVLVAVSYSGAATMRLIVMVSIGIALLFLLIRYFQGFLIGKEYIRYNTFHFLLYICTLEIAPLLIILKAIGNRVF